MEDNQRKQIGGSPVSDFARRWNIGESTAWDYVAKGWIRTIKIGPRNTRISYEEEERIAREGIGPGIAKVG